MQWIDRILSVTRSLELVGSAAPGFVSAAAALIGVGCFGSTARADDGFVEISQTCATRTGCFSGDSAGFPVTIDGSAGLQYRFASDLSLPDANTDAVVVSAFGVDLDLGGFAIRGPVVCTGTPATCVPSSGSGVGLSNANPTIEGVSVYDGAISGLGSAGIRLGDRTKIRNVRVRSNGGDGIAVGAGSQIQDGVSLSNGGDGIVATESSIARSVATANGGDGIRNDSGTVANCIARQNGGSGIVVTSGLVSGNTARGNALDGISATGPALIRSNVAESNAQDGIDVVAGAAVVSNGSRSNGQFGLRIGAGSSFRENTITSTTTSTVSNGGGVDLGANSCNGATTCP